MSRAPKVLIAVHEALALTAALEKTGWAVATAADAHQAYSVARQSNPAAAVLDSRLPRGGAIAALGSLRSSAHTAHIPIIAIVSRGSPQSREIQNAGVTECVDPTAGTTAVVESLRKVVREPPVAPLEAPAPSLASSERLAALHASGLLDSPPEASYDQLALLAARVMGTPVALVSIVDKDRQFFKSQVGLQEPWATRRQTPLSHSFCQWVVSGREDLVVEDSRAHPVLKSNLAIRDLGVIAYAGVPVRSGAEILGSLCAIDGRPRAWTPEEMATLRDIRFLVEALAAQVALSRVSEPSDADLSRHAVTVGDALLACVRMMRREPELPAEARAFVLEQLAQYSETLVKMQRGMRAT